MSFLDKAKAKIDAAIHPDKHNTTTHTTGSGSTNAGPHDSNLANKADPRVDSDLDGGRHAGLNQTTGPAGTTGALGTTGTGIGGTHGSTNAGPHNSNIANKLDPRVDSDLDGGRHAGLNQTTGPTGSTGLTGSHHTTGATGSTGLTGSHHTTGTTGSTIGTSHNTANTTAGPHSSDLANKLDPRVDSDLSGGHLGSDAQYTHSGTSGSSTLTGGTSTTGAYGSTNAGPHSSNIANKVDPRVDSDLDGGRHAGLNQTTGTAGTGYGSTGLTGSHGSTNAGPHSSNFANAADPRVDSDLDGSRNAGLNQTTTSHHGTTGTSAQPVHNSNLLNKLDPRVNTGSGSSTTY